MTLVAGLGNVGREYEGTRHNVGFMLVDLLLQELENSEISKPSFKGQLFKAGQSLFLKPSTFMNSSGESVLAVRDYYKCERLIVIHDDIDLNLGVLRFKLGGGNGGHNGLKSIDTLCGADYERVRVGIGKKEPVLNFVLGKFSTAELEALHPVLEQAKKGVLAMLQGENISKIASTYNLTLKKDSESLSSEAKNNLNDTKKGNTNHCSEAKGDLKKDSESLSSEVKNSLNGSKKDSKNISNEAKSNSNGLKKDSTNPCDKAKNDLKSSKDTENSKAKGDLSGLKCGKIEPNESKIL